jgi:hypothetical protein
MLSRRSSLVFALAESDEELPKPETAGKQPKGADQPSAATPTKDQPPQPLDFSVELADGAGAVARLPISRFRAVPLPLVARFTKLRDESGFYGKATEPVLQDFELPLASFVAAAPRLDPSSLRVIRLVFDRSPKGVVILEDVALVPDSQARTR